MSERHRKPDVLDVASSVSFVITDIPDLDEMLSVVARRVAEALGVWECDIYEYRPESDTLVATGLWSPELTDRDREWLGTEYALAERPSYQGLLRQRAVREYQVDDPSLGAADAEIMRRWGELSVLSVPLVFQDDVIGALTSPWSRSAPRAASAPTICVCSRSSRSPRLWRCTMRACSVVRRSRTGVFRRCSWPAGR